jgi:hypothetical protein
MDPATTTAPDDDVVGNRLEFINNNNDRKEPEMTPKVR